MDYQDEFYRKVSAQEKERRRQARKKRWDDRSKRFWRSLLFTEDGKPKSGFFIYTFCLSIVFLGVYIAAFYYLVEWLAPVTERWPVFWGNLLGSLCASGVGLLIGFGLHRLLSDKRLMFGTHLWLAVYAAAAIVTMAILLRGTGAMREFLVFFTWFGLIPVALGLLVFYLLLRRDHHPAAPAEEEPEWKKYVRRR